MAASHTSLEKVLVAPAPSIIIRDMTRSRPGPQLWLPALPRAHDRSQAGTKYCHESEPGGRLTLGNRSALRRGRDDRSPRPPTKRGIYNPESSSPWENMIEVVSSPKRKQPQRGLSRVASSIPWPQAAGLRPPTSQGSSSPAHCPTPSQAQMLNSPGI